MTSQGPHRYNGPRAVLGSQRVRRHRQRGITLDATRRWWLLRAEDGSRSVLLAIALALAVSGCARFQSKPISAGRAAEALEARTLEAPEVERFVRHNLQRDSSWPPPIWDLELLTLAAFYYHPSLE